MADHRLKDFFDKLGAGPIAGESLQSFKQSLKGIDDELEVIEVGQFSLPCQALGNSESDVVNWVAPYPLEITAIYGVKTTSADTATATMTADGNNPLSGTNIDMHGLTADTPASQTLSATAANLLMNTGNLFKCTFACGASGTLGGGAVVVFFKPIQPYE